MANPAHVALAKRGAGAVGRYRAGSQWIRRQLDLSGAMLSRAKLTGADFAHDNLSRIDLTGADIHLSEFAGANLRGAHLFRANASRSDLREANLTGASLVRADLSGSCLIGASLRGADLSFADLSRADLEGANLSGANLTSTRLSWANLTGAVLRRARMNGTILDLADLSGAEMRGATLHRATLDDTIFDGVCLEMTLIADCDLSRVLALERVHHLGPSIIGADSLGRSRGLIPESFLRSAGVAEALIASQPRLQGFQRSDPRVLLLGSVKDASFIERVLEDLRKSGRLCWSLYVDDEPAFRDQGSVEEKASYYDHLALVCSANSLQNPFGSRSFTELSRGESPGRSLLPLAIDDQLFRSGEPLCVELRALETVDMRGWEDWAVYQRGLAALAASLGAGTAPCSN